MENKIPIDLLKDGKLRLSVTRTWDNRTLDCKSAEWRRLRSKIMKRDDNKCRFCGIKLSAYIVCDHINGDASNNDESNLAMNCVGCDMIRHCGINAPFLNIRMSKLDQVEIVRRSYIFFEEHKRNPLPEEIDPECYHIHGEKFIINNEEHILVEKQEEKHLLTLSKIGYKTIEDVPIEFREHIKLFMNPSEISSAVIANVLLKYTYDEVKNLENVKGFFSENMHYAKILSKKIIIEPIKADTNNPINHEDPEKKKITFKHDDIKLTFKKKITPIKTDLKLTFKKKKIPTHDNIIKKKNILVDIEWTDIPTLEKIENYKYQGKEIKEICYCIFDEEFTDVEIYHSHLLVKKKDDERYYVMNSPISVEKRREIGKDRKEVLKDFVEKIKGCDSIISHQVLQDIWVIKNELYKSGMKEEVKIIDSKKLYCTMNETTRYLNLKNVVGKLKPPRKDELYKHMTGKDMPQKGNHTAFWDVKYTVVGYLLYQKQLIGKRTDEIINIILNNVDTIFDEFVKNNKIF